MNLNPMEQFAVKPLIAEPLFAIGGHPIYFTNQSLLMVIVAVASAAFLTLAVKPGALVRPKDPLEYFRKLRFHQAVASVRDYGVD